MTLLIAKGKVIRFSSEDKAIYDNLRLSTPRFRFVRISVKLYIYIILPKNDFYYIHCANWYLDENDS